MTSDFYETKWMFALLDYEHWRVFYLGQEVGLLILNTVDRSVAWEQIEVSNPALRPDLPNSFMGCYRWARQHEREH